MHLSKTLLFTAFMLCISYSINAQNYLWASNVGDFGNAYSRTIKHDELGNIYVSGHFDGVVDFDAGPGTKVLTSSGENDFFICKMDSAGNLNWVIAIGGIGDDRSTGIALDGTGYLYVSGRFSDTVDFDPGVGIERKGARGLTDAFLLKLDTAGNFVWAKTYGGPLDEFQNTIAVDSAGNVYCSGSFQDLIDLDPGPALWLESNPSGKSAYLSKFDAGGNFIWGRAFPVGFNVSGNTSIQLDSYGRIYLLGSFQDVVDFDPGPAVSNYTSLGLNDIYVSKFDTAGNYLWTRTAGGSLEDYASHLAVYKENIYITGSFSGTGVFSVKTVNSNGMFDGVVVKLDSSGSYIWANPIGGISNDQVLGVGVDKFGFVYATGYFHGSVDFDPLASVYNLTVSSAYGGLFICKYDTTSFGKLIWARSVDGSGGTIGFNIDVNETGNVHCVGEFDGITDFDPGATTNNLSSNGNISAFILTLGQPGFITNLNVTDKPLPISISPNPASDKLIVHADLEGYITIINMQGQQVLKKETKTGSTELDISKLTPGIYTVKITTPQSVTSTKQFIKLEP